MRQLSDYVDEDTTLEDFWREVAGQLIERVILNNGFTLALNHRDAIRLVIRTLYLERERQLSGTFHHGFGDGRRYRPIDSNVSEYAEYRWYETAWVYAEDRIGDCVFDIAEEIRAMGGYHLEDELLELCPSVVNDILWAITSRFVPEEYMVDGENYSDEEAEEPPEEPER
jgi:hypothetical protein